MFSAEKEHYVSYSKPFYGCSLIVQSSQDFVDMPTSFTLGQPGYYVRALVTPAVLDTDEAVRSLPLKQRQCLFPDEQVSDLQSRYRHQTCMTECRLRGILQRCHCIPFYFPHHSQCANSRFVLINYKFGLNRFNFIPFRFFDILEVPAMLHTRFPMYARYPYCYIEPTTTERDSRLSSTKWHRIGLQMHARMLYKGMNSVGGY